MSAASASFDDMFRPWRSGLLSDDELVEQAAALPSAPAPELLPEDPFAFFEEFARRQGEPTCKQYAMNAVWSGWFTEELGSRLVKALTRPACPAGLPSCPLSAS
jgi:hypothetical protein